MTTDSYNMWLAIIMIIVTILLAFGYGFSKKGFKQKALLNNAEKRLFFDIAKVLKGDQRIYPQVSYGEFLRHHNSRQFWNINARRADMVIADNNFNVRVVVEFQGKGHFGSGFRGWVRAQQGDRAKRRALSQAGIVLLEVPAEYSNNRLRAAIETSQPY